ncbi:DUF2293 domain-containing protein [Aspergillus lucknowensis]|uniref:DUF2293 domain-containing protein n=1 Tax=Aspergillus lucknowensis TaxID=176173 RepID=A0ABR4M6J2_9EURO
MTPVSRRSASALARRSPTWVTKRKSRKHKVILESVTQAKKKLRSVISFEAKAPPGYTFIPAGNPHFTTTCKELCRKDGLKVYAVSTTPHMHTHGLSQHVHRIGYHFPSAVVATVCMDRGLYLTATGQTVSFHSTEHQANRNHTNSVSQITINTEARDVLKDLFPNIPDNDLNQIIKTAFQKGQRKVGTAVELPLARRAQLAVVAHIRHIYTNYDRLLKTTSFHEARAAIEQSTLAKLVEWRGDDENGKTILEDVFREVIVISDDEDSDAERELQSFHGRDTSVEVISSNPVIEELQMRPFNHGNPPIRDKQAENSEDEAPPGFRFIPEPPKRTKVDRRGFSRYQAWDRAINRYKNIRSGPSQQPAPYSAKEPFQGNLEFSREPSRRPLEPQHSSVAPVALSNQRAVTSNLSLPPLQPVAEHRQYGLYPLAQLRSTRNDPPVPLNPPNCISLERASIPNAGRPPFQQSGTSDQPVFVRGPKEIHERNEDYRRGRPQFFEYSHGIIASQQDRVIPSIESPLPVEIKRPKSGHIEHLTKRMSGAFTFRSVTPHHQVHQDFSNHTIPQDPFQDRAPKRRRVGYYKPPSMENPFPTNTPPTPSAYPGNLSTTAAWPSVHNDSHARRRYLAPAEPSYVAERQPDNTQDPSLSSTRFNHEPQLFEHQEIAKCYDGQAFPSCRVVDPETTQSRIPGKPRITPDTRYALPVGSGHDRVVQPQPIDSLQPGGTQNPHECAASGARAPEVIEPRHESAWRSRNVPISYTPAEVQRYYADGFVRPIGIRNPSIPECRGGHRRPSSHAVQQLPQSPTLKFDDGQHRHFPSDSSISIPPSRRAQLDSQVSAHAQQHPVIGNQHPRYHDGKLYRTPPPVYQYERQPNSLLSTPRYDHNEGHYQGT